MYQWIFDKRQEGTSLSLSRLCSALGVSRSGYYDWLNLKDAPPSADALGKETELKSQIHKIVLEFPGYGYRRVTKELKRRDYLVNHKRVLRLMREESLLCRRNKQIFRTTDSSHNLPVYANLAKDMNVTDINQLWVADITYIRLPDEFVYLAVLIDVYSRKCVGWHLDDRLDTELPLTALRNALESRWHSELSGLVHHSDRGVQYASSEYTECLKFHNATISMSRKGCPLDNAFAESFIKTVKAEEVYLFEYETRQEAYERIPEFIDDVYNQKRLHSALGYLPPNEFEEQLEKSVTLA
jgi:transposase InsO family protein